jgi:hypothetical protein
MAALSVELHFIDVPASERWRRIEARNARKTKTYQLPFDVTREMFDFVESIWDSPTDAEVAALNGIAVAGSAIGGSDDRQSATQTDHS